jgi:hypothetical protein
MCITHLPHLRTISLKVHQQLGPAVMHVDAYIFLGQRFACRSDWGIRIRLLEEKDATTTEAQQRCVERGSRAGGVRHRRSLGSGLLRATATAEELGFVVVGGG